jgi:hypothetical protein
MTLRIPTAVFKHGRNTDEHQKRDGKWCSIGANVIAENIGFGD